MEEDGEYIKWFSELNKNSGSVAGGKGANLAEIYNLKVPVPPGFIITAQAYDYFIKSADLDSKIKDILKEINYEDTEHLTKKTNEIRALIENSKFPKDLHDEVLEAYETLSSEVSSQNGSANDFLGKPHEHGFVAIRSSATTEDLAEASFAGQQDTFLNVKGEDSLIEHIKKCFSSLFTPRATYYRNKKGFKDVKASLAVVVQKMIDSDKSGVIFSKDPSTNKNVVIVESVWGLGEGIVSGQITPDTYIVSGNIDELKIDKKEIGNKKIAIIRGENGGEQTINLKEDKAKQQVLKDHEIIKLAEIALKLEDHYKKPQDIEFAIESDKIYVVQTRPITTLQKKVSGSDKEITGEVVVKGLAASPGIGVGKVKIVHSLTDLDKVQQGDVLVTKMTNPDMVVTMQRCSAIVTDEGGLTAHAAIVSREMGIPAVVGTEEATTKLKEEEVITVDGFTGKVYRGKVSEGVQKEIKPVSVQTKTHIRLIVDLPSFAPRASKTGIKSVGLARLEGIIAESGKHPNYFVEKNKMKDYEEIIFRGLNEMASHFDEIWVRTSDIRSDEFSDLEGSPKEVEANPMLGMHGIRFSLKNPEILKAELNAMKRVASNNKKRIGVMAPQIISAEEVRGLKKIIEEIGFSNAKLGVMIETPAAVHVIDELCKEGIKFASFGTNDLTQYTLAIDRGNKEVQELYNEMHPAILRQMEHVVKVCRENGVESSICGQAGSKKEMAAFLVKIGIGSISVNADVASDIAEYVSQIEKGATGKEISPKEDEEAQVSNTSQEMAKEEPKENSTENTQSNPEASQESSKETDEKQEDMDERVSEIVSQEVVSSVEQEFPLIPGAEYLEKTIAKEKEEDDEITYVF